MGNYSEIYRSSLRNLPMRYNYDKHQLELVSLAISEPMVAYSVPLDPSTFEENPQAAVDNYEMELLGILGNMTADMFESDYDDKKVFIRPVLSNVSTALSEDIDLEGSDTWKPEDGSDREFRYNIQEGMLEYLVDGEVRYSAELSYEDWMKDPQYWVNLYSEELNNESDISLDTLDEVEGKSRISDTIENLD